MMKDPDGRRGEPGDPVVPGTDSTLQGPPIQTARRILEEKYHRLFHSIRDAILVADTDRNIIELNPAFTELFGYTMEDLAGLKTLHIYKSEEEYRELGEALEGNLGDPHFLKVVLYRKKSGEIFPGETNVFYYTDEEGEILGFIGLIRDITERLQAEAERGALISDLQEALASVKRLSGLIPICANCKSIRTDDGYWRGVEQYLTLTSGAMVSHGICPACAEKLYGDLDEDVDE